MSAERHTPSPSQETQIEDLMDKRGISYADAKLAIMGVGRVTSKPLSHDSFRGNPRIGEGDHDVTIGPGGLAGDAYQTVRDKLLADRDARYEQQLGQRVADGELSENQAKAMMVAYRSRHPH